ncbi:MAG: CRISPR-associated endonuclease Cas1 [Trebonia sp.]
MQRAGWHDYADGIEVVLLDGYGRPGARIASLAHSDPTVRRAQFRVADGERASGSLARAFIAGKIANMRVGLLRVGRGSVDPVLVGAAETLAIARMVLADAGSREEMLGHEGSATREYFRGRGRSSRPTGDLPRGNDGHRRTRERDALIRVHAASAGGRGGAGDRRA